jgi:menaquinone-dependent protoporphyrinogen oxidase
MSKRIFVGYATKTGSTKETAEAIARTLEGRGFAVDLSPYSGAPDPGAYDGFVLGGPVNGMAWHPEALAFVRDHAGALAGKPTAYFLLSIAYGVGRPSIRSVIPARLDPAAAIVAPIATACFGGFMSADPPLILRLAFGIKKGAPRDSRNWDEIRSFAEDIARKMA